ncbi:MAG: efflux RND transporter periplasmic adaptor subunit [Acidobacteriia bacterium]|nr:efflux RND transporter periplasmic adaptor subunit [Terriglobia bacterium]
MKKRIGFLGGLLLVILGGWLGYRWLDRSRGMVLTGIVTTHEVNVSAQIQGRLTQLPVTEGETVHPGQLLGLIEPQAYRADQAYFEHTQEGQAAQVDQNLAALEFQEAQTRDQIHQAQAALQASQAASTEAEANLKFAKINYDRNQGLYKEGVYPAQNADQTRSNYEAAKAHFDSLQKQVEAQKAALALAESNEHQNAVRREQLMTSRHQLAAAGAQTEKANVMLSYTEIRAPINGVVSALAARQGEVVNPSQPIVTLINPDDLWVRADVEETYIDRIRLGDTFPVRFPDGLERQGSVFFRGVDADYATQRDVNRSKRDIKTFEIRLRVDNKDRRIWPGLTAFVVLPPELVR